MIFFSGLDSFSNSKDHYDTFLSPLARKKGLKRHDILMDTGSHTSGCSVGGLIMEELKRVLLFLINRPCALLECVEA